MVRIYYFTLWTKRSLWRCQTCLIKLIHILPLIYFIFVSRPPFALPFFNTNHGFSPIHMISPIISLVDFMDWSQGYFINWLTLFPYDIPSTKGIYWCFIIFSFTGKWMPFTDLLEREIWLIYSSVLKMEFQWIWRVSYLDFCFSKCVHYSPVCCRLSIVFFYLLSFGFKIEKAPH